MNELVPRYEKEICPATPTPRLDDLSDREIVNYCLKNNRPAWEVFFKRHIPLIKQTIRGKLTESGYRNLSDDHEIVCDIHEKIVVKLYGRGLLRQCVNPDGIQPWLKTVAQNQTVEWMVSQSRDKRLPEQHAKNTMTSLSELIKGTTRLTLGDTIADENASDDGLVRAAEQALEELSNIGDDKKLWVLRLSILDQLPLLSEEIVDLSCFSGFTKDEVRSRVSEMMHQVEAKEAERIKAAGRAVILWHQIRKIEVQLHGKYECSSDDKVIDILVSELQNKMKIREQLLKDGRRLSRPANRDIAELVGLSEDQAEQVSTYIIRARKMMKTKMAKRNQIDEM